MRWKMARSIRQTCLPIEILIHCFKGQSSKKKKCRFRRDPKMSSAKPNHDTERGDDTLESLEARVHETEHKLLVNTLKKLVEKNPLPVRESVIESVYKESPMPTAILSVHNKTGLID